jgi:hypothetical protein
MNKNIAVAFPSAHNGDADRTDSKRPTRSTTHGAGPPADAAAAPRLQAERGAGRQFGLCGAYLSSQTFWNWWYCVGWVS